MHSSTSNSEPAMRTDPVTEQALQPDGYPADPLPEERPLPAGNLKVAAITAVILFAVLMGGWEFYWRAQGSVPSSRNTEGLWAIQRERIVKGEGHKTVLVGSSRTLSNVNLDVWERIAGERPIQLALEGTSPRRAVQGLADDPQFTGKLIIGVSPMLFFSGYEYRREVIDYYPKETPAQRWGQRISMAAVEPYWAFYDDDFALFTILKRQNWPQRPGRPWRKEVRKLFLAGTDRNMWMWPRLEQDKAYQDLAKEIWAQNFGPPPPEMGDPRKVVAKQIEDISAAVRKLRARGVEVTFVLHPADGPFWDFEKRMVPREVWLGLLQASGAQGIHFEDHPELQGYWLPEWSHIASADARRYTEALYHIIQRKRAEAAPGK